MPESILIDVDMLCVGMYIQLEVGWMNHPFPKSSFRLSSSEQIRVLRGLGLRQVRYVPSRSEVAAEAAGQVREEVEPAPLPPPQADGPAAPGTLSGPQEGAPHGGETLQDRLHARFQEAAVLYADVLGSVRSAPVQARGRVEQLVRAEVADLMAAENYAVHLLAAQVAGRRQIKHGVNVMVLSMLLGRSLGLGAAQLCHLASAGLLHDIGKMDLPANVAEPAMALSGVDRLLYEDHVQRSVDIVQRMGFLDPSVVRAVGEHHEMVDGSGFPRQLQGLQISRHGQILALVNRYDRLCNPLHGERVHTPHEALARLFAQERKRFDATSVLAAFIRLMGVYPPGSIVQLDDGRFARVVSSNSLSPLRPNVLPFEAGVPLPQAQVIDLGEGERGSIRRSVKFGALSDEALEFFMPGQQMCYFFARMPRAGEPAHPQDG